MFGVIFCSSAAAGGRVPRVEPFRGGAVGCGEAAEPAEQVLQAALVRARLK